MKFLQKCIGLLLALMVVILVVVGYANQQLDQSIHNRLTVGTTYMTMNNPFYEVINAEIEKVITEKGGVVYTRDPALSSEKQVDQLHYFIEKDVDVIILNPVKSDDPHILKAVQQAEQSGIQVIVVDSQLAEEVSVTSTIVSDNYQAGVLLAEHLLATRSSASILLLEHQNAVSGKQRISGFLDTIKDKPTFQIVARQESLGQTEVAMPVVEKLVQQGLDFDVVMALNDQAAIGAAAALEKLQIEQPVLIYGVDGSPDMKNLLHTTDEVTATASQSPIRMGRTAAELAVKGAEGQKVAKTVRIPVSLVTKETLKDEQVEGWQ